MIKEVLEDIHSEPFRKKCVPSSMEAYVPQNEDIDLPSIDMLSFNEYIEMISNSVKNEDFTNALTHISCFTQMFSQFLEMPGEYESTIAESSLLPSLHEFIEKYQPDESFNLMFSSFNALLTSPSFIEFILSEDVSHAFFVLFSKISTNNSFKAGFEFFRNLLMKNEQLVDRLIEHEFVAYLFSLINPGLEEESLVSVLDFLSALFSIRNDISDSCESDEFFASLFALLQMSVPKKMIEIEIYILRILATQVNDDEHSLKLMNIGIPAFLGECLDAINNGALPEAFIILSAAVRNKLDKEKALIVAGSINIEFINYCLENYRQKVMMYAGNLLMELFLNNEGSSEVALSVHTQDIIENNIIKNISSTKQAIGHAALAGFVTAQTNEAKKAWLLPNILEFFVTDISTTRDDEIQRVLSSSLQEMYELIDKDDERRELFAELIEDGVITATDEEEED